jgi:PAT family beta-lactamase induction signal transducer AmpG
MPADQRHGLGWREAALVYTRPRVLAMVLLGFSAGLPFLLVFTTLSAWLRDVGVERSIIGFFSWVGITYSVKVLWAPVIDRLPLPLLTPLLGKRRSWMLLAQMGIAAGLIGMATTDPTDAILVMAGFAVLVAFASATQDITIDAYRIESMDPRYQGAMAAAYVFGYRVALLVGGAGALYAAQYSSWTGAYMLMATLMGIGMLTTLALTEPRHRIDARTRALEQRIESHMGLQGQKVSPLRRFIRWFSDAVIGPFAEFFSRNEASALIILLLIGAYRISDITMGVMANPFYIDLGFTLQDIANVTKVFGFFMTIAGAAIGGILVVRLGIMGPLLLGAVLVTLTNLLFATLALAEPSLGLLALVVSADNLSGGLATAVFVAYLSSLTNQAYTATQYALFSSLMTLPAKFLGGFSGLIVDAHGYATFFTYSAALGLPSIALVLYLSRVARRQGSAQEAPANEPR